MKPDFLASLPAEITDCYRVFVILHSHHWQAQNWTMPELWEEMPDTVVYQDGDESFKKLLPPFFELTWRVLERGESCDLWPVGTLASHAWREWPAEEQDAVTACFALLWRCSLEQADGYSLSEILSTAKHIRLSWLPFLEAWFVSSLSSTLLAEALPLHNPDRIPDEARDWLHQPPVLARVEADFFAAPAAETATEIGRLHDLLSFFSGAS